MSVTKSLSLRLGILVALLIVLLIGALFFAYAYKQQRNTVESEVHAARNLILMAESVRQNMEEKWKKGLFSAATLLAISKDETLGKKDRRNKMLAAVPVVTAWESAKAKAKEGGFEFRTPRKGARNTDNEPDAVEADALARFAADAQLAEYYVVDEAQNAVRYFRPVRLGEACMVCHGDPAQSRTLWENDEGKDITGYKMDGKKVGDLHGAFEIIRPLAAADADLRTTLWQGSAIVAALLAAVLVVLWSLLQRLISRPLNRAVAVTQRVAEGDLSGHIEATGQDEVGQVMAALDAMKEKLQGTVGRISAASEEIFSASHEIARGSQDLSQRTEEQASSLEETASSMEQLTSTVKQNADNARQTNQLAAQARQQAEQGGSVVRDAVAAMEGINASSKRVADIIGVIDEIAFQTNLLALNAAVEAARAGEQGRGFAVVAAEVRKLAQRSADSAKEIKDLIQESVERVESGSKLVMASGQALEEIVLGIKKVSDIVAEISAASAEQSAGIEQVNKAVMQMDEVTQQNATLVERTASASQAMEGQAAELRQLISYFTLEEGAAVVPARREQPAQRLAAPAARAKPQTRRPAAKPAARPAAIPAPRAAAKGSEEEWEEF